MAAFLIDGVQNKRMPPDWFHAHEKEQQRKQWQDQRLNTAADETAHRATCQQQRLAALHAFIHSPDMTARFVSYRTAFEVFYQKLEPERYREAAHEAAVRKIENEHFEFPDFGVWLLEHRP